LLEASQLIAQARSSSGTARTTFVERAKTLLRQTEGIALPSGSFPVDDRALADRIATTDASLDAAAELISAQVALVARATSPAMDADRADTALRGAIRDAQVPGATLSPIEVILLGLSAFFAGLTGPRPDLSVLWPAVGMVGVALILFVVATLGRGLRERVRTEVALHDVARDANPAPSEHLRAADEALSAGRPRDAIRALYMFALTSLAAREVIRYDPALTDGELIVRAAGIPHADALRDLIFAYERAWFGLREPTTDEARRARQLAVRVAT
jgi:hypothetical protein